MSATSQGNLIPARHGPQNPHPLSTIKTELAGEGKYDEYGNRREVDIFGNDTMTIIEVTVGKNGGRN